MVALVNDRPSSLTVVLLHTREIDDSGIRALIQVIEAWEDAGAQVVLRRPHRTIHEALVQVGHEALLAYEEPPRATRARPERAEPEARWAQAVETARAANEKVVLMVEESEDERILYRTVLEHFGYVVTEAWNGEDAVSMARTHRPDLITIDSIPILNGWEATKILKADEATARIPVVDVRAPNGTRVGGS